MSIIPAFTTSSPEVNVRTMVLQVVLIASLVAIGGSTAQPPPSQETLKCRLEPSFAARRGMRNKRYCEILLIQGAGQRLRGCVYNTVCDNECPAESWSALDAEALKKEFNARQIVLNGPRYFLMDIESNTTVSKQHVNFDGVVMCPVAAIDLSPGDLLPGQNQQPFTETQIDRTTAYVYYRRLPIFLLYSPDHAVYIMQAYSQIVDAKLTYAALPALGQHMKLPDGWRYVTVRPKSKLTVRSHGTAHVLQDQLQNTYQRLGDEEAATVRGWAGK